MLVPRILLLKSPRRSSWLLHVQPARLAASARQGVQFTHLVEPHRGAAIPSSEHRMGQQQKAEHKQRPVERPEAAERPETRGRFRC